MSQNNGQYVDPWSLKRPPRKRDAFTITDPEQPGAEYAFELEGLDAPRETAALAGADALIRLYVGTPGDEEAGIDPTEPVEEYVAGDGEAVVLSAAFIQSLCLIEAMQTERQERRLDFDALVGLSVVMPAGFVELTRRANALGRQRGAARKNSSGAATTGSSRRPSKAAGAIPRRSTTSSAASTP
jgi:hypothetical protein